MPGRGVRLGRMARGQLAPYPLSNGTVDYGHPLLKGCVHLTVGPYNYMTGTMAAVGNSPQTDVWGTGLYADGSNSNLRWLPNPNVSYVSGEFTVWTLLKRTAQGTSGAYAWLFSRGPLANLSGTVRELELSVDSAGGGSFVSVGGGNNSPTTWSDVLPINSTRMVVLTRNSSNLVTCYSGGVTKGTVTLTGTTGNTTNGLALGYNWANSGFGCPGVYYTSGVVVGRCFTGAEVASLTEDPYQFWT